MRVSGELRLGETRSVADQVRRKVLGSNGSPQILLVCVLVVLTAGAGRVLQELAIGRLAWAPEDPRVGWIGGALIGVLAWGPLLNRLWVRHAKAHFIARGRPVEWAATMELGPDGLWYSVGAVEHRAQWSAVTELFRVKGYWFFVVQGAPYIAPRRFFPDLAAERAFVSEALSHMSEAARKRSAQAEAFIRPDAA